MNEIRKRGRPKKIDGVLTPKQRMARQKRRQTIFKEELRKHGLSQQLVYVDDHLFSRLKSIASDQENVTVHELVFLAMRKYLDSLLVNESYENYPFNLRPAIHAANQSAIDQGLTSLFSAVHGEFGEHGQTEDGEVSSQT